jgi:hypothetical protein
MPTADAALLPMTGDGRAVRTAGYVYDGMTYLKVLRYGRGVIAMAQLRELLPIFCGRLEGCAFRCGSQSISHRGARGWWRPFVNLGRKWWLISWQLPVRRPCHCASPLNIAC